MWTRLKNAYWALRQGPNLPLGEWYAMLDGLDFGQETTSGVRVSEESGTRISTVYACINILSRDMSGLPLKLYERKSNGGRAEVTGHPVAEWLKRPNAAQTPMQWRMRGWYSTLATGNQYDQIVDSGLGYFETVPLDSARMRVRVTSGLRKAYEYTKRDGSTVIFRQDQVFHNYGLSSDGFTGISPIRHLMETIGWAQAVQEYGAAYFRSPVPKVILQHPGSFKDVADKEKFLEAWKQQFAGKKGIANAVVLPNGMTVGQIVKIPNDEAQFIETQKLTKEHLAQIFLVPMHRLNALDRATFSNIEHQALEYVQYSLLPWLTAQEQAIEAQFLSPQDRERFFIRHNVDALLRGDFKTRMEGYASATQWGGLTINERRALENLPAIEGGDDAIVPMNMVRLKDLEAPQPEPAPNGNEDEPDDEPEEDEDDERSVALNHRAGLGLPELRAAQSRRRAVHRLIPRLGNALHQELLAESQEIRRNLGPLLREKRDLAQFWEWLTGFFAVRSREIRKAAAPALMEIGKQIAEQAADEAGVDMDPARIERFIERHATAFAGIWAQVSIEELRKVAQEAEAQGEDVEAAVVSTLERWESGTGGFQGRAHSVATHEGFMLANSIARMVFVSVGLSLAWATFGKNCAYCNAMRGKRVAQNEDFAPAGEFNPAGADSPLRIKRGVRQPPLHRGCDCMVVPG